jgi:hypothetical protein
MRCIAIIGATLLALLLTGCSAARLGYNNAPTLLYYWLDGYLDFDAAQSASVRESLQTLQNWHRKEELPLVAELLVNLQPAASQNVAAEEVCRLVEYVTARVQAPLARATPDLVRISQTLTPAQMEHLAARYEKRNREWRDEWVDISPAKRADRRFTQALERAETFYGRMTDAQRTLIREQLDTVGYDLTLQYAEMQRRQQDSLRTLNLLRSGQLSAAQGGAELQNLFARAVQSPNPVYRRYAEINRAQSCNAVATLHNATSEGQREKLRKTLQGYEGDARALMTAQ